MYALAWPHAVTNEPLYGRLVCNVRAGAIAPIKRNSDRRKIGETSMSESIKPPVAKNPTSKDSLISEPIPSKEVVAASSGIALSSIQQIAPLTPMQRDLYVNSLISPDPASFGIGLSMNLGDQVDYMLWRRALQLVIDREAILHTVFLDYKGMILQVELKNIPSHFELLELPEGLEQADIPNRFIKAHYDLLSTQPALRNFLVKDQWQHYWSITACHHILCDAPALKLFFERVAAVYTNLVQGQEVMIHQTKSFYECCAEINAQFDNQETLEYWQHQLETVIPLHTHQEAVEPQIVWQQLLVRRKQFQTIKQFCARRGYSLPTYFRFLYSLLLSKYFHAQADFVIYNLINGRPEGYQETLGCFYQIVPTLIPGEVVRPGVHFDHLLRLARNYRKLPGNAQHISTLLQHQILKNEHVRYYFNFYNFGSSLFLGKKIPFGGHDYYSLNEVHLVVNDQEEYLELLLYYDQSTFGDAHFLKRILAVSQQVINGCCDLRDLDIVLPEERQKLLQEENVSTAGFCAQGSIARLFEKQVEHTPSAIAVSFEDLQITYQQLNERAELLARHLRAWGVTTEVLVALLAERSISFVTAMLAIFKAGGAYLPLSPSAPRSQLAYTLAKSQAPFVLASKEFYPLSQQVLQDVSPEQRPQVDVLEDLLKSERGDESQSLPSDTETLDTLAYVIYTSGSTGEPKGTMIEQRGMLNHLAAKINELHLHAADTLAQTASQAFDISVWQWLACLLVGGRVQIVDDYAAHDPVLLLQQIERYSVTILETVPSLLQEMFSRGRVSSPHLTPLRLCLSTGEILLPELVQKWLHTYPQVPLINAYGPTECSDDVTHHFLRPPLSETALNTPIGHGLANIRLYVLDQALDFVAPGASGELYVGGVAIGRGYIQEPAKTAEAFLPDPFHPEPGKRMYKTGDIVRRRADGNLEYFGRVDRQVKLRGFRVELGEIEANVRKHPNVSEAVVVVVEASPGDKRLVAYIVAREQTRQSASELRGWMRLHVPEYSVPAAFVFLECLPLTANGKIDQQALPSLELASLEQEETYAGPSTVTEERVAQVWSEVLGVSQPGIYDNFFGLGGNSLLAIQIITRLRDIFHPDLSLRSLFIHSTIAHLAAYIDEQYT